MNNGGPRKNIYTHDDQRGQSYIHERSKLLSGVERTNNNVEAKSLSTGNLFSIRYA